MPGYESEEQRKAMWANMGGSPRRAWENLKSRVKRARDFSRGLQAAPSVARASGKGLADKLAYRFATMPTTLMADKAAEAAGVITETLMKHYLDQAVDYTERSIAAQVDLAEERMARRLEKAIQTSQMAMVGSITPPEGRGGRNKEAAAAFMKARADKLSSLKLGLKKRKLRSYTKDKELQELLRRNLNLVSRSALGLSPDQTIRTAVQLATLEQLSEDWKRHEGKLTRVARELEKARAAGRG